MSHSLQSTIKSILPVAAIQALKTIRNRFGKLPEGLPVAQMYFNSSEIRTFLGINNFFSFLVPEVSTAVKLEVIFYNHEGRVVLQYRRSIRQREDMSLDVQSLFRERGIKSELGLVTIQMKPESSRDPRLKRLGEVGSHYYAFYEHISGKARGSVGHVHPSSVLSKSNRASGPFVSNQSIFTRELNGITLLQANPSFHSIAVTHSLVDTSTGETMKSIKSSLGPLSTKLIQFDFTDPDLQNRILTIEVSPLPTSNSKPLLIRKSKNNIWSYSHS